MKVILEIFVARLLADKVVYHRSQTALSDPQVDPDLVVRTLVENHEAGRPYLGEQPYLSHSTSWRYEPEGAIVLTYLVCAESIDFAGTDVRELPINELALAHAEDSRTPRPISITETNILSHALRHHWFLLRNGGAEQAVSQLHSPAATDLLGSAAEAVAGRLS